MATNFDNTGWWLRSGGKDHRIADNGTVLCGTRLGTAPIRVNRSINPCTRCAELWTMQQRTSFIETLLNWLERAQVKARAGDPVDRPTPRFFDAAMAMASTDFMEHNTRFIPGEEMVDISDLPSGHPLDVRYLTLGDDVDTNVALHRWRAVPASAIRGKVRQFLPYPLEWTLVFPETGEWKRMFLGRAARRRWVPLRPNSRMVGGRDGRYTTLEDSGMDLTDDEFSSRAQLSIALALGRYYVWRVYFGFEGHPGIEFPTDPTGAREAFRLRDIPAGAERRRALRHWVEQHWRMNRIDPSDEVLVRKHLSGATDFVWGGLVCRISPSESDLATLQQLIHERYEARLAGTDRRPRVAEEVSRT